MKLNSIGNARELGGIIIDEKTVKRGVLLRTASLSALSPEDRMRLENDYHVAAVVDLRMSMEREQAPDPEITGARNIALPVMEGEDFPGFDEETARMLTDPKADRFELLRKSYEMGLMGEDLYVDFLFSHRGKKAWHDFFCCLFDLPEGGAILWHCTDGKDRTGVASMLILSALGAGHDTIIRDYMLTNQYNEKKLTAVQEGLKEAPLSPELKELALFGAGAVFESYMENALEAMRERCGSAEGYLTDELGLDAADIRQLRRKFLV